MPLFSEHIANIYYGGSPSYSAPYSSYSSSVSPIGSSYSASYLNPGGTYSSHSSLGGYSRPPLSGRWVTSSGRNYAPILSTISERGNSSPVRIASPRRIPLMSRKYTPPSYTPRPITINTADIDVSRDKYRQKAKSPPRPPQPEPIPMEIDNGPFMPRVDGKPETGIDSSPGLQRSTIRRGRTVVRLHTVKRKERESPRKSQDELSQEQTATSTDTKTEATDTVEKEEEPLRWRDKLSEDLIYKDKREKKSLGEKLKEKFIVKDKDDGTEIASIESKLRQDIPKMASSLQPERQSLNRSPDRRCSVEMLTEQANLLDSLIRRENLSTATLDLSKVGLTDENKSNLDRVPSMKRQKTNKENQLQTTKSDHALHNTFRSFKEPKQYPKRRSLKKSSSSGSIRRLDSITEFPRELPAIEESMLSVKRESVKAKPKMKAIITSTSTSVDVSPPKSPLKFKVEDITVEEKLRLPIKEITFTSVVEEPVTCEEAKKNKRTPKNYLSIKNSKTSIDEHDNSISPEPDDGNFWDKIGKRETVYLVKRRQILDDTREKSRRALFWFPESIDESGNDDAENYQDAEIYANDKTNETNTGTGDHIVSRGRPISNIDIKEWTPSIVENASETTALEKKENDIDESKSKNDDRMSTTITSDSHTKKEQTILKPTTEEKKHDFEIKDALKDDEKNENRDVLKAAESKVQKSIDVSLTSPAKTEPEVIVHVNEEANEEKMVDSKSTNEDKLNLNDTKKEGKDKDLPYEPTKKSSSKKSDNMEQEEKMVASKSKTEDILNLSYKKEGKDIDLPSEPNKKSSSKKSCDEPKSIEKTKTEVKTESSSESNAKLPEQGKFTELKGSTEEKCIVEDVCKECGKIVEKVSPKSVSSTGKPKNDTKSKPVLASNVLKTNKDETTNKTKPIDKSKEITKPCNKGQKSSPPKMSSVVSGKVKNNVQCDKIVTEAKQEVDKSTLPKELQTDDKAKEISISHENSKTDVNNTDVANTPLVVESENIPNSNDTNIETVVKEQPEADDIKAENLSQKESNNQLTPSPVAKLPSPKKPVKQEAAVRPLIATPRPLQKRVPQVIHSSSSSESSSEEDSSEDEDADESDASEDSAEFFECENNTDGRTSTGSNDSGFDSSAPNSPANFISIKKGGEAGPSTGVPSQTAATDITEQELEQSTAYDLFRKTGRFTPPARSIPRFRKYMIEDFHFIKVLGKGSFGKVLLAELRDTEYYYAVKCLKKDVVLEDDDVECTLIERKVLALGTNHPYLCHLFATFQTDSHLFFVMEYLNGGDLMFHIQQSGRFPEARARFYAAEIVSGLKFLHKRGIIYRDLKLDNILLDFDGHVRIADFGMCKLQIYLDKTADTFCGTPDYMAPEIIKGLKYNQAVDWWSFGVLLYEMLIGQSPFSGCDEDELFWSICNEMPSYPRFLSSEALAILTRLLDKDAQTRLGGAECMYGDVRDQDFFRPIHWDRLERRELEAPFKPRVRHPMDTQYFDRVFTGERPRLTAVEPQVLRSMDQQPFRGFSYTNPNATDR